MRLTRLLFATVLCSSLSLAQQEAPSGTPIQALKGRPTVTQGPLVDQRVTPIILSKDLRVLPTVDPDKLVTTPQAFGYPATGDLPRGETTYPAIPPLIFPSPAQTWSLPSGPALGSTTFPGQTSDFAALAGPGVNFPGLPFQNIRPPDTQGDVGPNHYIQAVNGAGPSSVFRIWDKTGTPLTGVMQIATLWSGMPGSACAASGFDPIVVYDQLADRWVITQVGGFFVSQCIVLHDRGPHRASSAAICTDPIAWRFVAAIRRGIHREVGR